MSQAYTAFCMNVVRGKLGRRTALLRLGVRSMHGAYTYTKLAVAEHSSKASYQLQGDHIIESKGKLPGLLYERSH